MTYDVIIVGAGPAGIFTALELVKKETKKKILIIEKGRSIDKRHCPKEHTKNCVYCKPYCHITTGFSGAGAFSDGKLSLSYEVGGELPDLIGTTLAEEFISYTDDIYLEFGADTKIEGIENSEAIKEIRRKSIEAGLKLVDCPIRHLGTEKAQEIYYEIQKYLLDAGVEISFNYLVKDLFIEDDTVKGVQAVSLKDQKEEQRILGEKVIVAAGRKGADWLKNMCTKHHIDHRAGTVDIGVRVEVRNEVMERVNNVLYESKLIGYPVPFRDKVRTFCQNPGGFVSQENYDDDLAIVNGHSYKDKKSDNTNLAILSSHNFLEPFNQPIQYGKKVSELVNMLGNGSILVQRYGDILEGKRTWEKELSQSNVSPTLPDAVAGDLTSAIPYRPMSNILNFIEAMNTVVPGFASRETLLYGPEVKFYSNKININEDFETNIKGLYCLGDSSGWTRGLMMASVMGVMMGRKLTE
ncbi:FAD-binding protein [Serpentinicella sp. ANB-PHB4]|uniref:NAD(P)/FAD-dependent oxidoreductase n=1 Tax=Serpentinicella sp. ANB-PHB4 TaxID=3074076 RepID=UPI00285B9F97|nr:FAD-binding protein [Serpentinicella sp. ANB-PHB4]MDR5658689.1 FAD-binding protein [Serpentinicella sp. ANB-PHB4]